MLAKSILIVFLMAVSLAKTSDDMMNTGSSTRKKTLKEVTIKEATKNPETYSVDTIKQAAVHLGTQFKRGIESNKQHMEHFFTIHKESQKTVEKMKREYLVLAKKLKKFYQKTRELIEISEEINKDILKGNKARTLNDKTIDLIRPLKQFNVTTLGKNTKSYVFRMNIEKNKE